MTQPKKFAYPSALYGWRTAVALALLSIASCQRLDPTSELAAGAERFAAGDYATAVIHVSNVLQARPDDAEAHLLRAKIALAIGDAEVARVEAERAAALGAVPGETARLAAEAALLLGDYSRVPEILAAAPAGVTDAGEAWVLRARALLGSGAMLDAERALESAAERGAAPAVIQKVRADIAAARGETAAALVLLDDLIGSGATDPELYVARGQLRLRTGRSTDAVDDFARAASLYEGSGSSLYESQALFNVVRASLAANDPDSGREAIASLVKRAPQAPLTAYARALMSYRDGAYDEAVAALQSALTAQPDNPGLLTLLGAAQLARGNVGQAEQSLLKVVTRDTRSTAAAKLLAETRLRQNRPQAALEVLRPLVEAGSTDAQVSTLSGLANVMAGNVAEGIADLEAAAEADPGNPVLTLELARAYSAAGRESDSLGLLRSSFGGGTNNLDGRLSRIFGEARAGASAEGRAAVAELLADFPGDARALTGAAMYHQLIGEVQPARSLLEQAVNTDERFTAARLLLAGVLTREGQTVDAERQLREVLAIEPQNGQARAALAQFALAQGSPEEAEQLLSGGGGPAAIPLKLMLAELYINTGRDRDALATLRQAADASPSSVPLRVALGRAELRSGNASEAIEIAKALQTEFPSQPSGHLLDAEVRMKGREYAAAVESARRAYELQRTWQTASVYLRALRFAGRSRDALEVTARWVADNSSHVPGRLTLAAQLQEIGREIEALREYEAVLAVDPESVVALNNAAWIAYEAGDDRDLELARRAAELAPDNGAVLDTLGVILLARNREADAVGYLERAAQSMPEVPEIRYHLAQALARSGRSREARAALEQVLRDARPFTERSAAQALLDSL
jgi:putative PEP-CTERM system TPR-repeat lipoprotein